MHGGAEHALHQCRRKCRRRFSSTGVTACLWIRFRRALGCLGQMAKKYLAKALVRFASGSSETE